MKRRADEVLVEQGLAPTRSKARALIMAGQVRIGDRIIDKAGSAIDSNAELEVVAGPQFVSRGGEKLSHALDAFRIDPTGSTCADFGASTGGFTDVLLQRGAAHVYAIDVGYGQLDYRLRTDSRVTVMERANARYLESLPQPIDLVVIDVSFISLTQMFQAVARVLKPEFGICIALVKPQFEAGKDQVGKGGVVRDRRVHKKVLNEVAAQSPAYGLFAQRVLLSPITGPKGNREFLMLFDQSGCTASSLRHEIEAVVEDSGDIDESEE
jgi:23S rRNA (cytidine1920-2'-O)/16S rRNA (cytidine1409-2'-O)-methyltransferase